MEIEETQLLKFDLIYLKLGLPLFSASAFQTSIAIIFRLSDFKLQIKIETYIQNAQLVFLVKCNENRKMYM